MNYFVIREKKTGKYWSGANWEWTLDKAKKYRSRGIAENAMIKTKTPEFGGNGQIRKSVEEKMVK